MFSNSYQRGLLTVFFSGGAKPLAIWDVHIGNGYVQTFLDKEISAMVLEIAGPNVTTTYMTCPKSKQNLGIRMPFLVMVVRNIKKYFSFEITILDETNVRRRFRASNFQSTTSIQPLSTAMPIRLSDGWNQIQFNLAEFTQRAYKKQYMECVKIKVNANIRLRRIYFAEKLVPEKELPREYRLFLPIRKRKSEQKLPEHEGSIQEIEDPSVKISKITEITQTGEGEEGKSKVDIGKAASQIAAKDKRLSQAKPSEVKVGYEGPKQSQLTIIGEEREGGTTTAEVLEEEGEREGEAEPPAEVDGEGPEQEGELPTEREGEIPIEEEGKLPIEGEDERPEGEGESQIPTEGQEITPEGGAPEDTVEDTLVVLPAQPPKETQPPEEAPAEVQDLN